LPAGICGEDFFLGAAFFLVDGWRMGLGTAIVIAATIETMADTLLPIHRTVSISECSISVFGFRAFPVVGEPA
jgi:hypothetical protein